MKGDIVRGKDFALTEDETKQTVKLRDKKWISINVSKISYLDGGMK